MSAYFRNKTAYGSLTGTFNSYLGTLDQPELKVVVLQQDEFTKDNIKVLLDKKAYGIAVVVNDLQTFSPSKEWTEAYQYTILANHFTPFYFLDNSNKTVTNLHEMLQSPDSKLIADFGLGATHSKIKLVDFVVNNDLIRVN